MRYEVYADQAGEWRWRAVARNGKIVADGSEGYASERNAKRALTAFQAAVREPEQAGPPAVPAPARRRCSCKSPTLSKTASNICTGCGLLR